MSPVWQCSEAQRLSKIFTIIFDRIIIWPSNFLIDLFVTSVVDTMISNIFESIFKTEFTKQVTLG